MFDNLNIPEGTKNLLLINILLFVATLVNEPFMIEHFAMFYPTSPYFHIWQVVTHMFMHGGWWHIFFNMYSLFIFGSVLERMMGTRTFIKYYFICGLGAVLLHTGVEWIQAQAYMAKIAEGSTAAMQAYQNLKLTPTVGASGAIYGLLIGYAMMFPQSQLTLIFPPITLTAKWWIIIFAAIELFTGVTGFASGIAHFAHLGGMLIGFILITNWRKNGKLFSNRY